MKKLTFLFLLIMIPFLTYGQFEQKLGINISGGIFKTFGKKIGAYDPYQMPNYGMGLAAGAGVEFRIAKKWSITADFNLMAANKWDYHEGDNNNYLYWTINDPVTGDLISEGYNYLDFRNYGFGIKPKFYLTEGKKWIPFLFAGVNINLTRCWYENTYWAELNKLDMLPPDDTGPYNGNLENNTGIGFNPGIGVEYSLSEKIKLNAAAGYYFILLNKENFKSPDLEENLNAVQIHIGIKFNFLKSKNL
jgi:opacity protein-like surface antigen